MALTKVDDRGLKTPIDLQDNEKIRLGTGNDLEIVHNGTYSLIKDDTKIAISSAEVQITDAAVQTVGAKFVEDAQVELYHNGSKKLETTSTGVSVTGGLTATNHITLPDDVRLKVGTGEDLHIYHNQSNSVIREEGTGNLNLQTTGGNVEILTNTTETSAKFISNGAVELYHDNEKRLETVGYGTHTIGQTTAVVHNLYTGGTKRAGLRADNSNTFTITDEQGHSFFLGQKDAQVELYHDNSKKLETTTNGAKITGGLTTAGYGNTAANNTFGADMSHGARNINIFASSTSANPYYSFVGTNLKLDSTNLVKNSDSAGSNWGNVAGIVFEGANQNSNSGKNPAIRFLLDQPAGNGLNYSLGSHEGDGNQVSAITSRTAAYFDTNGHFYHPDNKISKYGDSEDLQIYHDGTYNIIKSNNSHNLEFKIGSNTVIKAGGGGEAQLLYAGSKKIETTNTGATVTGTLTATTFSGDGIIPAGGIIIWSGASNAIPTGWLLCDGSNSTPDLRNRFVVGAGDSYSVGATGGSDSVTLTTSQIPSHNHSIQIRTGIDDNNFSFNQGFSSDRNDSGGTFNSNNTGGGQSHENRPPYYALCYIMKS